ncbi:hypothetical protein Tco_0368624 [Tanacetum coccineum]
MKNDWKLYDRLMRIESGLGWDLMRKNVDSTPDWGMKKLRTQLPTEFQNNDSPSNIKEELGAANIEGTGDSDEFNLGLESKVMRECCFVVRRDAWLRGLIGLVVDLCHVTGFLYWDGGVELDLMRRISLRNSLEGNGYMVNLLVKMTRG